MIDRQYFEERAPEADEVLGAVDRLLSALTGRPSALRLVPVLEAPERDRLLRLNVEVFGPGNAVFDGTTIDKVAADPDALFLLLDIDGSVEGCCFGYYEDPGDEVVEATEFFLDSAMVSAPWQGHGIGWLAGAAALVLVDLLEDVHRVGIAVWDRGDVGGLLSLYRRLGFVDAESHRLPYRCLAVTLDEKRVTEWRALLGLGPPVSEEAAPSGATRPHGGSGTDGVAPAPASRSVTSDDTPPGAGTVADIGG